VGESGEILMDDKFLFTTVEDKLKDANKEIKRLRKLIDETVYEVKNGMTIEKRNLDKLVKEAKCN
jgi:hypothetical protein